MRNAINTLIDCQEWLGNGPLSELLSERTMKERINDTLQPALAMLDYCKQSTRTRNQLHKLATPGNYIDSASRANDAMRLALATFRVMPRRAAWDESDILQAALAMLAYRPDKESE